MKPADFKRWRKMMGYSQKDAAEALGLKRRVVQYYEKGERDGETVKIPRSVRLACKALMHGYEDYHGPTEEEYKAFQAQRDKQADDKKKKKKKDGDDGDDTSSEAGDDNAGGDDDDAPKSGKSKPDSKGNLTQAA